ncbi:synaptogenesis protein syg-2 [Caerostris extrusa]|uniref:Synaptogenesis protein syg-2 n=1 Tax=Caerostris extrusa TaxID=172846 RepID=A0AAV4VCV7_CAEEX|nr:synaptogenesis protein syg-2 [Caerostris extrusa]
MSFDEDKHRRYTTTSSITLYPRVDDNGAIYSCEARHPTLERYLRCSVAINVLHAPGIPQIEGYIEGDVVTSGDTLTLACITRGGNPPPQLIWKRGNVQVDATYTVRGHVTTNIHTFRVDATDNNGVYRCEASSNEIEEPIAASVKLSVHFYHFWIPIVSQFPFQREAGGSLASQARGDHHPDLLNRGQQPPSQITWVVDGSRVVGGESVTNRMADGWVTASNLTITLTRQGAKQVAVQTCRITSRCLGSPFIFWLFYGSGEGSSLPWLHGVSHYIKRRGMEKGVHQRQVVREESQPSGYISSQRKEFLSVASLVSHSREILFCDWLGGISGNILHMLLPVMWAFVILSKLGWGVQNSGCGQ